MIKQKEVPEPQAKNKNSDSGINLDMKHEPLCVGEATCIKCGETKHVLAFCVNRHSVNGLNNLCRDCDNDQHRKRYRKRHEIGKRKAQQLEMSKCWK